jgi:hypothetical protein
VSCFAAWDMCVDTLQYCRNFYRPAVGAIYAAGSSNVTVRDSELASSYVKDYFQEAAGGACYVTDTATLSLLNSTVRHNEAQAFGGGVAMGSKRWVAAITASAAQQHELCLLSARISTATNVRWTCVRRTSVRRTSACAALHACEWYLNCRRC